MRHVKLSLPAILDRILHLASQTMKFGVSYFIRYFDKTPKICCYGLIASYCNDSIVVDWSGKLEHLPQATHQT